MTVFLPELYILQGEELFRNVPWHRGCGIGCLCERSGEYLVYLSPFCFHGRGSGAMCRNLSRRAGGEHTRVHFADRESCLLVERRSFNEMQRAGLRAASKQAWFDSDIGSRLESPYDNINPSCK